MEHTSKWSQRKVSRELHGQANRYIPQRCHKSLDSPSVGCNRLSRMHLKACMNITLKISADKLEQYIAVSTDGQSQHSGHNKYENLERGFNMIWSKKSKYLLSTNLRTSNHQQIRCRGPLSRSDTNCTISEMQSL